MPFIELNSGEVLPFSHLLLTSLCWEILCASVGDSPLVSHRMQECRRKQIGVILESRIWPWPQQVASNHFLLSGKGSVPGMTQSDQAGPRHKPENTAATRELITAGSKMVLRKSSL